jgi:serine/threonine protein kinase
MSDEIGDIPGVRVGDVVGGKYQVERLLGVGGMGIVVAAQHMRLGERVALKVLHPRMTDNREAVVRFEREARAAARIKSEHVAKVTDVGELDGGAPYMVMEYLEGIDLFAWIQGHGAMSIAQAITVVLQVCEALAEAHVAGIVHRDLKPANLFYCERPDGQFCVKILDFGISKLMDPEADQRLTAVQTIMGSPIYMSPEQMQRKRGVDARTDVWSIGVILFELLTLRPPFEAGSVAELAVQIATEPAPRLGTRLTAVPPDLELAVAKCLEKDRDRRFQNVGELALALASVAPKAAEISIERILATLRVDRNGPLSSPSLDLSHPVPSASSLAQTMIGRSAGEEPDLVVPRRRRFGLMAGIGVAAVVLLAATWGRSLRGSEVSPATSAVAADAPPPASAQVSAAPPATASDPLPAPQAPRSASAPASAPIPVPRAGPRPSSPPSAVPPRAPPSTKPSKDCDPSYYYDARGKKHFKPECFE